MFLDVFEIISNVFVYPLVLFEQILSSLDGSQGIFFAGFAVLMASNLLLLPLRGRAGASDRARKHAGLKEPNKDSSPEGKAASDDL